MTASIALVPPPPAADGSLIGRRIAERYEVLEVIGRGGMGIVYSARDEQEERDVVIKFLSVEWAADADARARFEREAARLGALQHPNIVRMLDFGHDDGRAYLVMEFVRGEPLSRRLKGVSRLSLEEFVPIAAQILKGVGHAHTRGVVLRDIKASNVMLCNRKNRADFVVLLDFGLAKLLDGDTQITREYVMGTAGYIAPEALSAQPSGLGVDVYALGVLFWTMLTGSPPFAADDDAAMFYKTVHEPVPSLADVITDDVVVPTKLAALIESCLAKSPDDRPSDANAIVEIMIDSVPTRMFRLPRIPGSARQSTGEGNTGLISLTGVNPSARHESVPHVAAKSRKLSALWLVPLGLVTVGAAVSAFFVLQNPDDAVVPEIAANQVAASQPQAAPRSPQPEPEPDVMSPEDIVAVEAEAKAEPEPELEEPSNAAVANTRRAPRSKRRRARTQASEPTAEPREQETPPKTAREPSPAPRPPSPAEPERRSPAIAASDSTPPSNRSALMSFEDAREEAPTLMKPE